MYPLSVAGLTMRTTSSVESLNSVLGRSMPKHPNVFRFMDHLRLHEFAKYMDFKESLKPAAGEKQFERQRKDTKDRAKNIQSFTTKLELNEINVVEFMEGVSGTTDEMFEKLLKSGLY